MRLPFLFRRISIDIVGNFGHFQHQRIHCKMCLKRSRLLRTHSNPTDYDDLQVTCSEKKNTHILRLGVFPSSGGACTIRAGQYEQYFNFALFHLREKDMRNWTLELNVKKYFSCASYQTRELASQDAIMFCSILELMSHRGFSKTIFCTNYSQLNVSTQCFFMNF